MKKKLVTLLAIIFQHFRSFILEAQTQGDCRKLRKSQGNPLNCKEKGISLGAFSKMVALPVAKFIYFL